MFDRIHQNGLVLLGCGKMGSSMLGGWLAQGLRASAVTVIDPHPSAWLLELQKEGVQINNVLPAAPAVLVIAVKPQIMVDALKQLVDINVEQTLFITVAAGVRIAHYQDALGIHARIIRAMPNTPAAVCRGITAIIGNHKVESLDYSLANSLLSAVGQVVRLETEMQMDAVTAISGSGPAYVFHMVEALALAGEKLGLSSDLAMQLARETVTGSGELLHQSPDHAGVLRQHVTSPNGTTAAALDVLMNEKSGLPDLIFKTAAAAAARSQKLGR